MTLLILSFPRAPSSAHFGNTSLTLLEPCFSFSFVFLCIFLFCCHIFIRLAFIIAFASWSFACMILHQTFRKKKKKIYFFMAGHIAAFLQTIRLSVLGLARETNDLFLFFFVFCKLPHIHTEAEGGHPFSISIFCFSFSTFQFLL